MGDIPRSTKYGRARKQASGWWTDKEKIKQIYDVADQLNEIFNITDRDDPRRFVVDHIVPLQSDEVCGLEHHLNMGVITALENGKKSNSWWPDMPEQPTFDFKYESPPPGQWLEIFIAANKLNEDPKQLHQDLSMHFEQPCMLERRKRGTAKAIVQAKAKFGSRNHSFWPARCNKRSCQARRTLKKHIDDYERKPKCHVCGSPMYIDYYRACKKFSRAVCSCDGYPFPHKIDSVWCKHFKGEITKEHHLARFGHTNYYEASVDLPDDGHESGIDCPF